MAATARTDLFDPDHPKARISNTSDVRLIIRLEETRPPRPGVELRARPKKGQAAKAARVDTLFVIVQKHATKRSFRPMFEKDASLVRIKTGGDQRALFFVGGRRSN